MRHKFFMVSIPGRALFSKLTGSATSRPALFLTLSRKHMPDKCRFGSGYTVCACTDHHTHGYKCTWVSFRTCVVKVHMGILQHLCPQNAHGYPFALVSSKCTWVSFTTCVVKMHMGILSYLFPSNAHGYPFVLVSLKCTWASFSTCVIKMHMGILSYFSP